MVSEISTCDYPAYLPLSPEEGVLKASESKVNDTAIPVITQSGFERISTSERWYQLAWTKLCSAISWLVSAIGAFFKSLFGIGEQDPSAEVKSETGAEVKEILTGLPLIHPGEIDANSAQKSLEIVVENLEVESLESENWKEIENLEVQNLEIEIPSKPPELGNPPIKDAQSIQISSQEEIHLGGIPNISNSCYMNSCLQSIVGTSVRKFIEMKLPKPDRPEMNVGELLEAFHKRLNFYHGELNDWNTACKIQAKLDGFKNAYDDWEDVVKRQGALKQEATILRREIFESGVCPTFEMSGLTRQKDAPELMLGLLPSLGIKFTLSTKTTSTDNPSIFAIKTDTTRILELHLGKETTSFQKLIENYSTLETIDDLNNKWDNEGLKYSKYTREYKIAKEMPEVIFIQLKRMEWNKFLKMRTKLGTKVTWETDAIDLASMIDPDLYGKGQSTKYTLIAYISHKGTPQFGHYTANILNETTWFKLDDEKPAAFLMHDEEKSDREQAYLFVLKRVEASSSSEPAD